VDRLPRAAVATSALLFIAIASYSILDTHDYLAEKRVRWAALQDLIEKDGARAENVDAGWVYNAPTSFGIYGDPRDLHSWFKTREYVVTSNRAGDFDSLLRAYDLVRTYPVRRWAPWHRAPGGIVILHRIAKTEG
jgi:hypothetical protein